MVLWNHMARVFAALSMTIAEAVMLSAAKNPHVLAESPAKMLDRARRLW